MMILRCVETIEIPATNAIADGVEVPVLGQPVLVTRGWFQCSECSVVGVTPLASPMMPPLCAQPSCVETPRLVT